MITTYRNLDVWNRAMQLVEETYQLVQNLPRSERFGIISQMTRAAISIPANIAEGNARLHRGEYIHHLSIARGSLAELVTFFELTVRLAFLPSTELEKPMASADAVGQMLNRLIDVLSKKRKD